MTGATNSSQLTTHGQLKCQKYTGVPGKTLPFRELRSKLFPENVGSAVDIDPSHCDYMVVELHATLLEALVWLPLLQRATLDVLVEGHRLVVELHPTLLEALAPFFCPMLKSHLVTSNR